MKFFKFLLLLFVSVSLSAQTETDRVVSFTKGLQATIILPIAPDIDKGRYYKLDRCENNQIIFEEEHCPKAHVPYIIVPNEDFSIDLNTLDLTECRFDTAAIYGIRFVGSYFSWEFATWECYDYYIIDTTPNCRAGETESGGYYLESPIIGALRAFLEVDWSIHFTNWEKMPIILHNDDTSISTSSVQKTKNLTNHYNLQGQRISVVQKGINIVDGKKVWVK